MIGCKSPQAKQLDPTVKSSEIVTATTNHKSYPDNKRNLFHASVIYVKRYLIGFHDKISLFQISFFITQLKYHTIAYFFIYSKYP